MTHAFSQLFCFLLHSACPTYTFLISAVSLSLHLALEPSRQTGVCRSDASHDSQECDHGAGAPHFSPAACLSRHHCPRSHAHRSLLLSLTNRLQFSCLLSCDPSPAFIPCTHPLHGPSTRPLHSYPACPLQGPCPFPCMSPDSSPARPCTHPLHVPCMAPAHATCTWLLPHRLHRARTPVHGRQTCMHVSKWLCLSLGGRWARDLNC